MVLSRRPLTPARLVKPLLVLLVMFYLGFNAVHGERGLVALMREQRELATLQAELASTRAERERLEHRVVRLRSDSLDLDLLDEQMRRMLGVMKPDEVVVLNPTQ